MNFVIEFFKVAWQFLCWTAVNILWKPVKWVTVGTYNSWKSSKKKPFKTDDAVTDAQKAAAKSLPELTKKADDLKAKMKKLSDEWNKHNAELQRVESVIYVASGEFVKPRPQRKGNNNQNNNQKQKGNQNQNQKNNGQQNVPAIGDADFSS